MHYQAVTTAILVALAAAAAAADLGGQPYRVEKTHADLLFDVDHAGFTHKHGSFRNLDAALQYDAQHPEQSHVSVTVQVDSIDTGFAPRDQELKGEKFLDVAKYPVMGFESIRVTPGPNHTLVVEGNLTLHGVTRPLTLQATLNKSAPNPFDKAATLGFSATGSLKRSDFGVSSFVPMIGDEVRIEIDAEFNQKAMADRGS
jgi:polyisoprenoid-binding protein YceI